MLIVKRGVFMCNNSTDCNECLRDILKVILLLQKNACPGDNCLDTCDKKYLSCGKRDECNTRPVTLYTAFSNGTEPWSMPVSKDPEETTLSSIFRIEKIDGNCCTFRVLRLCRHEGKVKYVATESFFTITLACICAIKCLEDASVDCV